MDLCYMTSELKLLRIHTYFLYKCCPFRLSRLNTGKVVRVRGSGKLDGSFAEHHLYLKKKKKIHQASEAAWFAVGE